MDARAKSAIEKMGVEIDQKMVISSMTAKLTAKLAQARETGLGDLMFLC